MYLADAGNWVAVGAGDDGDDGDDEADSVDEPPEHADRVPSAMTALRPTNRMRSCLLM
jgi:hypothetical protein